MWTQNQARVSKGCWLFMTVALGLCVMTVTLAGDGKSIQEAIDALPPGGGVVTVPAGTHVCFRGLRINRSDVTLRGEGQAILKLASGVNQPVLLVGGDAEIPAAAIRNIRVENLQIDGSQKGQTSETDPARPWIRNNGIDVRRVHGLVVDKVRVHDARSGGIVISWGSSNVTVTASDCDNNFFDGIAFYDSVGIMVNDFCCTSNGMGGMSFDNRLKECHFTNGRIESNGDVGLFARNSWDLVFSNIVIRCNGAHGAFLSAVDGVPGSGVIGTRFVDCIFERNKNSGIWLASAADESSGTEFVRCRFVRNEAGSFLLAPGAEYKVDGKQFPVAVTNK